MNLEDSQIIARIKSLIPTERHGEAVVYLDTQPKEPGERITLGRQEFIVPFAGHFIFIDLMPIANWGHPAMGVLLAEKGEEAFVFDCEFPPFFGTLPDTIRKLPL
ncbi:MAG: hypothetical protein HQL76_01420 [Magnetococcales bacterium]|nr:hypothetical protein [Magnetococcales bacterium]